MSIKVSFVIGGIAEEDFQSLKEEYSIITKLILTPQDHELFHYNKGNSIQAESSKGDRIWCRITDLEMVINQDHVIVIFTLLKDPDPE